jgi:hypothetical protein
MGDGRIFLKTAAPLPFIKICRMSLILAGSISLDSTFTSIISKTPILQFFYYYFYVFLPLFKAFAWFFYTNSSLGFCSSQVLTYI